MRKNLEQVYDKPYKKWVLIDTRKYNILGYRRRRYPNVKRVKRSNYFLGDYR